MSIHGTTARKLLSYIKGETYSYEIGTVNQETAEQLDGINEGQNTFLQAGVVASSSWSFTATIVASGTGAGNIGSASSVAESTAWLPDPVKSGALMLSVTPAGSLSGITPSLLPASGKYVSAAVEIAPGHWEGAATVTVHSGAEYTTEAAALEHPPATTAGRLQVRRFVIHYNGTSYTLSSQEDVRPYATRGETSAGYSEGLAANRLPAAVAGKGAIYYATDTHVYSVCTGSAWYTLAPRPQIVQTAVSVEAKYGEMLEVTASGKTITLPAPQLNAIIGVWSATTGTTTVTASSGDVYGDFIAGSASVTLAQYQHVLLQSDGTNWLIVAGEPKRTATYSAVAEAVSGTEYENMTTRPIFVNVWAQGAFVEGHKGELEVILEGEQIFLGSRYSKSGGGEENGGVGGTGFWWMPGKKWKAISTWTSGGHSIYYRTMSF